MGMAEAERGPEAFGFVPAHIVADLQDIGNWKSRATAIDALQKHLRDMAGPSAFLPNLNEFVKFLMGLIADPNFKIAISSMSILGDLAAKVGEKLEPHLRLVVPALLEKLADSKILVRSANMKVLRKLMSAVSPAAVLGLLATGAGHSNWRVREEVLNAHIMALLSFDRGSYDPAALFRVLSAALTDSNDKVRMVSLEGMALLNSKLSAGEFSAFLAGQSGSGDSRLSGGPMPEALRSQVLARLTSAALPCMNADGIVEHPVKPSAADAADTDFLLADAAFGGVAGAKLPWDTATTGRPRLRAGSGLADVPLSAQPVGGGLGLGLGGRSGSDGSFISAHRPPHLLEATRLSSDSLAGGPASPMLASRTPHPQVPQPQPQFYQPSTQRDQEDGSLCSPVAFRSGGSVSHPHVPSRLGGSDHFPSGGAPIVSASPHSITGWSSHYSHPPGPGPGPGRLGERPSSPLREPGGHNPLLDSASFSERGSNGSATGPAHGPGPASTLHPLKHHWGASRSLESQAPAGASKGPVEPFQESPLSPTRGFQTLMPTRQHGVFVGPDVSLHHSREGADFLARPASVRTQAAAELRDGREAREAQSHSQQHGHQGQGILQQQHSPVGPGPSLFGHAHERPAPSGVGLWLQNGADQELSGARQETFSPSKAEMLARLKNRQIEKRAATAQMESSAGSDVILAHVPEGPMPSSASYSCATGNNPSRRHLFTQLSDPSRADPGPAPSRGYHSVLNTPTRAGAPVLSPFDEAPGSAARPPRTGLAGRLGRGASLLAVDSGGLGMASRSPSVISPGAPPMYGSPSDDTPPARSASPGMASRGSRVRSAEPSGMLLPGTPRAAREPMLGSGGAPATPGAGGLGGSFWEKGRQPEAVTEELTPVAEPDKHIRTVMAKLIEANNADRKELDWQGQYDALLDGRRLVRHHPEAVRAVLHEFVRAWAPAMDQLRSQTAKCALALCQEIFNLLGRAADRELDEIAPVLLKKAGEVSNAGRDNFLSAEADKTLSEMSRCCGESRVAAALLACAGHKNPYVRGKVAFHLDSHLDACSAGTAGSGGGNGRAAALTGNWSLLERLFKAGAAFLDEGSLDTRTYGKRVLWHIKSLVGSRSDLDRLVSGIHPESLQRKVCDVVEGLNGPPPPPSRGVAGGAIGSRLAARPVPLGSAGNGGQYAGPARALLETPVGLGSLTQPPPPPARQGSYSAPAPGVATPERRRLSRQRTGDLLDGIPESGGAIGSTSSNGRTPRVSAGAAAPSRGGVGAGLRRAVSGDGAKPGSAGSPTRGASGYGPSVQETVVKALQLLGAKDFRERMDALRSVESVAAALPGAPDSLLVPLLDALVARLGDPNAKVSMQTCELVGGLAACLRGRLSLALNTLVPALGAALGSANEKIRGAALGATDALVSSLEPSLLVQHLSHCVGSGTLQRGRPILVEKLVAVVTALHGSKPQLVARYAVPAAFTLLNDGRGGEAKAAANALLGALARLMGPALSEQAVALNAVAQQRVADAVAAAAAAGGGGDGVERSGRSERGRGRSYADMGR